MGLPLLNGREYTRTDTGAAQHRDQKNKKEAAIAAMAAPATENEPAAADPAVADA